MSLWGFLVVFGERGKKGEGGVGGWMCWYEPGGRVGGTGIVGLGFEARGEGRGARGLWRAIDWREPCSRGVDCVFLSFKTKRPKQRWKTEPLVSQRQKWPALPKRLPLQPHKLSQNAKTHSPETSDFGLLAFSTSPLLLDERASSSLRPCPRSLLFLSPLRFSCSATARFPSSSSLPFLIFRSSLARLSRSRPSAFLLARFSSFSLTTHGLPSTSFRNAVFSAQAAASSFVVRTMAMRNTVQSRSLSRLRGPVETYISARATSASFP